MTASGIPMICIDDKRAFNIQYRASSIQLFLRLIILNRSVLNFYRNLKHRKGASHCQPPPFFLSLFCTAYRNGPNNKHFTRLVTLLGTWTPIINNRFLFPFSLLYRFSLLLSSSYVVIVLLLLLLQYANWFLAIYAYGTGTLSPVVCMLYMLTPFLFMLYYWTSRAASCIQICTQRARALFLISDRSYLFINSSFKSGNLFPSPGLLSNSQTGRLDARRLSTLISSWPVSHYMGKILWLCILDRTP